MTLHMHVHHPTLKVCKALFYSITSMFELNYGIALELLGLSMST